MINEYYLKSKFLKEHRFQDLILKVVKKISFHWPHHIHNLSKGMLKAVQLDLAYTLFRHQPWLQSPTLADFAVDFLVSEYKLGNQLSYEIVDSCIDLLQGYTPTDKSHSAVDIDRDFLRQILVACVSAEDDQSLSTEIGFGSSLLSFISSVVGQSDSSNLDAYVFSSDLVRTMEDILSDLNEKLSEKPWIIDLYRLQNLKARKSLKLHNIKDLTEVSEQFCLLETIGWEGSSFKHAKKMITDLSLENFTELEKLDLIYQDSQGAHKFFRLSQKGLSIIAGKFTYLFSQNLESVKDLPKFPELIQCEALKVLPKEQIIEIGAHSELYQWHPKTLRILLERLGSIDGKYVLDFFSKLSHNALNSWAKSEICMAVAGLPRSIPTETFLQQMLSDDSERVRKAARTSLNIRRSQHYETRNEP